MRAGATLEYGAAKGVSRAQRCFQLLLFLTSFWDGTFALVFQRTKMILKFTGNEVRIDLDVWHAWQLII